MGTVCSCARSDQAHVLFQGRSSSFADVYLTGRRFDLRNLKRENGVVYPPHTTPVSGQHPDGNYPVPIKCLIDDQASSSIRAGTHTSLGEGAVCHAASRSTLDEPVCTHLSHGSAATLTMDTSSRSAALSAPTTPYAIRLKPPPKPPRMRQLSYDGGGGSCRTLPYANTSGNHRRFTKQLSVGSATLTHSPNPSLGGSANYANLLPLESPGASSVNSAFNFGVETNSVLDMSFGSNATATQDTLQPVSRIYPTHPTDKVANIIRQTKDFLLYEIDVELMKTSLLEKRVLDMRAVSELGRKGDRTEACETLLDMIMAKSHPEFLLFCDTLKHRARCPQLADLLLAIDSLLDLGSEDSVKKRQSVTEESLFNMLNTPEKQDTEDSDCPVCRKHGANDPCDFLMDTSNFDAEIMYIDKVTGQTKPSKEIFDLKRDKLVASAGGDATKQSRVSGTTTETGALSELLRHEADRYIPVIYVSLYNYCLWDRGMDKVVKAIARRTCIRELSLSKCHLGIESIRKLSKALHQTGVYKLDLRLNSLCDESFIELKRYVAIKVLNLSSTDLSANSCKGLLQAICRNQSTQELDIGFNDLQNGGCDVISEALTSNCPLRKLRIRDNGITADGVAKLFKALKRNSRLVLLDVSSNEICQFENNYGLAAMSEMLRYNRTLRQLNIENCGLGREACSALARALKSNTMLRSLDMSMNPLNDEGVEALSEGLKYNQVLDVLCLNMCEISNYGFIQLLDALKFNMSLKTLKMCYNKIGRNVVGPKTGKCYSAIDISTRRTMSTSCSVSDTNLNLNHESAGETTAASTSQLGSSELTASVDTASSQLSGAQSDAATLEKVYDKLCHVLQQNKDLKVLLWGNKLEEDEYESSSTQDHQNSGVCDLDRAIAHPHNAMSNSGDRLDISLGSSCDSTPPLHRQGVAEMPTGAFSARLEAVEECAIEHAQCSCAQFTNHNTCNGGCARDCSTNGYDEKMSKLNSLQRNFVQQYTIHNGQLSNNSQTNALSKDKPTSNNGLISTQGCNGAKFGSPSSLYSSTNTGKPNSSINSNGYANNTPTKPKSVDSGYGETPVKEYADYGGFESSLMGDYFQSEAWQSTPRKTEHLQNSCEPTSQPLNALGLNCRSGDGGLTSKNNLTGPYPGTRSMQVSPRMGTSVNVANSVAKNIPNGQGQLSKQVDVLSKSFTGYESPHILCEYSSLGTSIPNCYNGTSNQLSQSMYSTGLSSNASTASMPTFTASNVHQSRIRTNGSLPRKPKTVVSRQQTVIGSQPVLKTNGIDVNPSAKELIHSGNDGSNPERDEYRPHTIPRRGGKTTLV